MDERRYERFLKWLQQRKPEVRVRLLRLNPSGTLDEGRMIRGYHRHHRANDWTAGRIGRREFVAIYGREAWARLPRCCVINSGHRKSVTRESVLDEMWKLPADHPFRQARKEKGQWIIQAR